MPVQLHHDDPKRSRPRYKLVGSRGSAVISRRRKLGPRDRSRPRREGVALIIALTAIAILAVMLADMHESTSTAFVVSTTARDQLRAEYMAKSGINLTRLLVATEPQITQAVGPIVQMLVGRAPHQVPVWNFADEVLAPFCRYEESRGALGDVGIELASVEGLGELPGTCEIVSFAENGKINVNDPLNLDGTLARRSVAMQLFGLTGGYQSPSIYDPLFQGRDAEGMYTTRLDIVTGLIDWWDIDTQKTTFDPGANEVSVGGGEDDATQRMKDPYKVKNAPFDSLEEIRLVRGITDDFWATFVEPRPDDPRARTITIYGSGGINPNDAPPETILARVCSFRGLETQPLCGDPLEAQKFITLVNTARAMAPVPFFSRSEQFIDFLEGKGGPQDLYPLLLAFLGEGNPLIFQPLTITPQIRGDMIPVFVLASRIITIASTGRVGRAEVTIEAVMNFHDRWVPPPPNAGTMPPLGIFHHYRVK